MKVPEGYNKNDYYVILEFLEQPDKYGVKNGEKLSKNYDSSDPKTWGVYDGYGTERFQWIELNGELRIRRVIIYGRNLCGALNLSGCIALKELCCWRNNLIALDVSGCVALEHLSCQFNNLNELDVSDCSVLKELYCYSNKLTSLNVSACAVLEYLVCGNAYFGASGVIGCPPNCQVSVTI